MVGTINPTGLPDNDPSNVDKLPTDSPEEPLETYNDNGKVVDELFMATISREPIPAERELSLKALEKSRVEGAQNLQWALLNIVEFLYNF